MSLPPRILIVYDGTRGDAQPWMVAARALIDEGFEVMITGSGDASSLAKDFQVPFTRSRLSLQKFLTDPEVTEKNESNAIELANAISEAKKKHETDQTKAKNADDLFQLMQDWKPQLLLVTVLMLPIALSMANYFQIPVINISLQAARPSKTCPPMGAPLWLPTWLYGPFWRLWVRIVIRETMKDVLPALSRATGLPKSRLNISSSEFLNYHSADASFLSICCTSEAIHGGLPAEFCSNHVITGALMPSLEQQLSKANFGVSELAVMEDFLSKGDAPVYLGFGSIMSGTSKTMTLLCLRAMKITGERCIILRGWSRMDVEDVKDEPDEEELRKFCAEKVLFVDSAPHGWLFPRCKVVVHHGGAGTLNASCLAGVPTVIVAIFADQPEHATLLNKNGLGVGFMSMKQTTPQQLAQGILKCINTPSIREKAKEVAERMAKEDGVTKFVEVVKDYMESHVKTGKHMELKSALERERKSQSCCCFSCCSKNSTVDSY